MEQSQDYGHGQGGLPAKAGSFEAGNALLNSVTQATTIDRGLSILRVGYADFLAEHLGGALNQQDQDPDIGGGGVTGEPAKIELSQDAITNLNQLYVSLTTDHEAWAEALIANTPMAEGAEQSETQTASRAAMA